MKDFPVVIGFPVHWGEMDALGHVNNARYFTWFESVRIEMFRRTGLLVDGAGMGPVLATATCDFLKPVVYPADVRVGGRVEEVGRTSVKMAYAVVRADSPDERMARGSSVAVIVDYRTGQKVPLPDELREKLLALR
ncbi:MAG: thioesterase family protein [Myxococcota bacterium]